MQAHIGIQPNQADGVSSGGMEQTQILQKIWELRSSICKECRKCYYWQYPEAFIGECPRWDKAEKKDWKKEGLRPGIYALVQFKPCDVRSIQRQRRRRFTGSPLKHAKLWRPTAQEMRRVRRLYDGLPKPLLKFVSANTGRIPLLSTDVPGAGASVLLSSGKWGIILGGLNGKMSKRFKYLDRGAHKKMVSDEHVAWVLQHELIHMAMLKKMVGDRRNNMVVFSRARIFPHAMTAGYSHRAIGIHFHDCVMDESMAMVGGYYEEGDTVRSLAEKICGFSVVEKVKTSPYGRRKAYKTGKLTMAESILYSRAWFKLINGQITPGRPTSYPLRTHMNGDEEAR